MYIDSKHSLSNKTTGFWLPLLWFTWPGKSGRGDSRCWAKEVICRRCSQRGSSSLFWMSSTLSIPHSSSSTGASSRIWGSSIETQIWFFKKAFIQKFRSSCSRKLKKFNKRLSLRNTSFQASRSVEKWSSFMVYRKKKVFSPRTWIDCFPWTGRASSSLKEALRLKCLTSGSPSAPH